MAALVPRDTLDSLDIPSYDCVYVSFGSKSPNGSEPHFEQSNPYFLKHLSSRYLCIAIDPGFKKEIHLDTSFSFVTLPVDILSDQEAQRLSLETQSTETPKNYYQLKVEYSKRKTEELTQQIVQLLNPSQRVFFVNFIKFVTSTAHDAIIGKIVDIVGQLGPFQKDYYEWGGYRYPHLIIKQMCEDIPKKTGVVKIPFMISSDRGYKFPGDKDPNVLSRMYNDFSTPTGFLDGIDPVYAVNILLKCVIDIRQESQLQLEALKGQTAGKRTRRRRRKTKRRS
jgi:hypothetical protein